MGIRSRSPEGAFVTKAGGGPRAGRWLAVICLVLTWSAAQRAAAQYPGGRGRRSPLRIHAPLKHCPWLGPSKMRAFFTKPQPIYDARKRRYVSRDPLDLLQQCCWRAKSASPLSWRRLREICAIADATGDSAHVRHCSFHRGRHEMTLRYPRRSDGRGGPDPVAEACGAFASTCQDGNVCRTGPILWGGSLRGPFRIGSCKLDVSVPCGGGRPGAKTLPPLSTPVCALQASAGSGHPQRFLRHRNFVAEVTEVHTALDRADAQFEVVPGLTYGVSFESVNFPGHYLRVQGSQIRLQRRSGDATFSREASFGVSRPATTGFRFITNHGRGSLKLCLTGGKLSLTRDCFDASFKLLCGNQIPFRKK